MKLFILEYTHLSFLLLKKSEFLFYYWNINFKSRKIWVCEEASEF